MSIFYQLHSMESSEEKLSKDTIHYINFESKIEHFLMSELNHNKSDEDITRIVNYHVNLFTGFGEYEIEMGLFLYYLRSVISKYLAKNNKE